MLQSATGHDVVFDPTPIEAIREFSEDFAIMLEWFDRVGYEADIPGLAAKYGIEPTPLADWAASVPWGSDVDQPA